MSILPCGNGFAVGAADPAFALLGPEGAVHLSKAGVAVDMRSKARRRLPGDCRWPRESASASAMAAPAWRCSTSPVERSQRAPPRAGSRRRGLPGSRLATGRTTRAPKLAGKPLQLKQYETSRSLAIAADVRRFVLGTAWSLRAFDPQGREQWRKPSPGAAWGVNVTGDGRMAVAAYGDGTIRWHRMSDGEELLALFVHRDDLRWVAWTPSGYYMASPGGEDLIGWHVNRGWDQAADFFPASRFRERFNRPDVVQKILDTLDERTALEEANREARIRTDLTPIGNRLPPVIRIISPAEGASVREREVTIEYELRSPSGLPVDLVEVQIDGRPSRGIKRIDTTASGTRVERQTVSIPAQDVQLALIARSGSMASEPAIVRLKWGAATSGGAAQKPKLYGVIVGVSAYRDPALNLRYAAKDAKDFAAALTAQKGGLYRDVELKVLTDGEATTTEVKRALSWLERSVASRDDVGLVFLAGHGVTDEKNRYHFLTADADRDDIAGTAIDGVALRERTRSLPGKALVFLDTCHAGAAMTGPRPPADINGVVNELSRAENGVITFASSTGREVSQEDASWGNGAFTKALLEGLPAVGRKGRADLFNEGAITTAQLNAWLARRVKELTRGAQNPVMVLPATIPDFTLFTAGL